MDKDTMWLFVIDTNEYAGNFERQLCAFLTGRVGQCEVGDKEAELFREESGIDEPVFDNVIDVADDGGCARPATVWNSPKHEMKYNSVGIWFDTRPTEKQIEIMMDRAKLYCEELPKNYSNPEGLVIEGYRIIKEETVYTTEEEV